MGKNQDLFLYSMKKVKKVCEIKGLVPGQVIDAPTKIQFTRGTNKRLKTITWDEFEAILNEKNLEVWGTKGGWMKIFSKDERPVPDDQVKVLDEENWLYIPG